MASQADRQIRRDPTRRRVKISVKGYSSEACGKRAPAMYSPIVTCQMTIFANLIRRVLLAMRPRSSDLAKAWPTAADGVQGT